jgi:NADH:ubiquinone oxidoreductase subunit F (NADH-binding)
VTAYIRALAGTSDEVAVVVGPRLLRGVTLGPGLIEHGRVWPEPPTIRAKQLVALVSRVGIRGRGGAGFPLARKLETAIASGRRRAVVVNGSEGEPASAKDGSLLLTVPHLVLDGAEVVATALGVDVVEVVVPGDRPAVLAAVDEAVVERRRGRVAFEVTPTTATFVGGQARSVLELLEGRENLPVTSWVPEAVKGLGGLPTLLSNAETFAQLAALVALGPDEYERLGTREEPGTTLLTVAGDGPGGVVLEVPFGVRLADVLAHTGFDARTPVLMGGYHGAWLPPEQVQQRLVSRPDLAVAGAPLGAGVILPVDPGACPVVVTAQIVAYLAARGARRCGPCKMGLPALADASARLAGGVGRGAARRVQDLAGLVEGRGACAHPDGTARLVRSLLQAFPDEVRAHEAGTCSVTSAGSGRRRRL